MRAINFNVQSVYTQADGLYVSIASPYSVYSAVYYYKCLTICHA